MDTLKTSWENEYQRKGIPSSFRKDATKPIIKFVAWLRKQNFEGNQAADIGCGLGRNSFYLASQGFKVTGIELLEDNVRAINKEAMLNNLPVQAFALNAADNWPIPSNSLDIVIDVFCYKHIVNKDKQLKYRRELQRTLKPNGFYFISLASENDGYYGPLLASSINPKEKLIVDPVSNIASFLYSIEGISKEFADYFEVVDINEQISSSPMYEKEYSRSVINAIFKKI